MNGLTPSPFPQGKGKLMPWNFLPDFFSIKVLCLVSPSTIAQEPKLKENIVNCGWKRGLYFPWMNLIPLEKNFSQRHKTLRYAKENLLVLKAGDLRTMGF